MYFQPMIEKVLLVFNGLATRNTCPSKTLVAIGCNLHGHVQSSMASSILLRTNNSHFLVQRLS